MATFNSCQFIGRLGKDPDFNVLSSGKPVVKFSLAVDQSKDGQGKDKGAMWLNVVAWDKLAEIVERYAEKRHASVCAGPLANSGVRRSKRYQTSSG